MTPPDGHSIAFAGLYEFWRGGDGPTLSTCTIITTPSAGALAEIHDRMPLVLPRTAWARWLDPTVADPSDLLAPWDEAAGEHLELRPVATDREQGRQQRRRTGRAGRAGRRSRRRCSDRRTAMELASTPRPGRRRSASTGRARRALLVLTHGAGGGVETRDVLAVRGRRAAAPASPSRWSPSRTGSPAAARPPAPDPQDEAWLPRWPRCAAAAGWPRCRCSSAAGRTARGSPAAPRPRSARPAWWRWRSRCTRRAARTGRGWPSSTAAGAGARRAGRPRPVRHAAGRRRARRSSSIAGADHALRKDLPGARRTPSSSS